MQSSAREETRLKFDIVTLGRSSVDLYGQQIGGRLEDVSSFAKYVGGCPTNIAVGTAKLGLKSALLTGVGDDHMGRFISEELDRNGVSLDGVKIDPERLTALVLLGVRDRDSFPLIFYRENCADMALTEDDVNPELIQSSAALLISGTHLSTPSTFAASMKAVSLAKEAGRKVVFDIDYRPVLWGLTSKEAGENRFVADQDVTDRLQKVAGACDLIVGTEEEFHILGGNTDTLECLKTVRGISTAELVCKLGPDGCVVFKDEIGDDLHAGVKGPGFRVEVFNVLGAGDGFLSGYLSGWLRDMPTEECCRRANACGAIVVSRHGCAPAMPTEYELEVFLASGSAYEKTLTDGTLDHAHWVTTRLQERSTLMAFAIDHRSQCEDLVDELDVDRDRIPELKQLAFDAFHSVAKGRKEFGMLLENKYGEAPLAKISDFPYWIGRPIELPGSRPIRFESSADVATELHTWPANHVVKCLCFYHPNDDEAMKQEQERKVLELFDACRKTGHELLLEIIPSKAGPCDDRTTAVAMQRFYDIGVYPDWWKLEPALTSEAWLANTSVIEANDPKCRGIVVLGLSQPIDSLVASLKAAAQFPLVRGFAVGRTLFEEPLRKYLKKEFSAPQAVSEMAGRYALLCETWLSARAADRSEGGPQ